jgi:hypothetical protein
MVFATLCGSLAQGQPLSWGVKTDLILAWAAVHTAIALAQSPFPFIPTGSMSTPRVSHTATLLLNGKVLIAGGGFADDSKSVSASAELYDPATGAFTPTGSMTTPRTLHTATLLPDGRVLIAGGQNTGNQFLATAELYDPSTGTFTPTGSMTSPRACSATLLADGRVLVVGCALPSNSAIAEVYDPTTGTFSTIGTSPYPPDYPSLYVSTMLADNRVLIHGRCGPQVFDPDVGTFTRTGYMSGQCSDYSWYLYTSALLPDGKVLFVGSGEDVPDDIALYDPAAGTFASLGTTDLNYYSASTPMPDGTVLITGGDGTELYMPAIRTFTPVGGMTERRNEHTSTLLPDGTVLLTGGWTGWAVIASAEIYRPGVPIPAPSLFSAPGGEPGQGAILHAGTARLASPSDPATAGEYLEIYGTGLAEGSLIPPRIFIGGRMAKVLWFGDNPVFAGLNQINVRVPDGIAPGPAVPVHLTYLGRPSNEVTIGVQ